LKGVTWLCLPAGATNALGPLYFATFCALSVTLGALFYNLTGVLNEYFTLQQQLTNKPKVWCILQSSLYLMVQVVGIM
jgi:hypothetical protein